MTEVFLASRNPKKIEEMRRILDRHLPGIVVLGLDDATLVGAPRRMVMGEWARLREPDSVIIDRAGYMLLFPGEPLRLGGTLEMNDHLVRIVGISEARPGFVSFPIIHARYSLAVNFQGRERSQMSFVLVRPQPGVTAEEGEEKHCSAGEQVLQPEV